MSHGTASRNDCTLLSRSRHENVIALNTRCWCSLVSSRQPLTNSFIASSGPHSTRCNNKGGGDTRLVEHAAFLVPGEKVDVHAENVPQQATVAQKHGDIGHAGARVLRVLRRVRLKVVDGEGVGLGRFLACPLVFRLPQHVRRHVFFCAPQCSIFICQILSTLCQILLLISATFV